ncbi:MAG: hypothetical protein DRQ97_12250, partial [Gammaproteobacteria bacterium]
QRPFSLGARWAPVSLGGAMSAPASPHPVSGGATVLVAIVLLLVTVACILALPFQSGVAG